jgi:hypothetical protein
MVQAVARTHHFSKGVFCAAVRKQAVRYSEEYTGVVHGYDDARSADIRVKPGRNTRRLNLGGVNADRYQGGCSHHTEPQNTKKTSDKTLSFIYGTHTVVYGTHTEEEKERCGATREHETAGKSDLGGSTILEWICWPRDDSDRTTGDVGYLLLNKVNPRT